MLRRTALRQFSSYHKPQLRLLGRIAQSAPSGVPLTIQRVRFKKPPLLHRRNLGKILVYAIPIYVLIRFLRYVVVNVELTEEDEQDFAEDENAFDEEDGEERGFFISVSWPKQQPRTFYRGSDPEWQEFLKFSQDSIMHIEVQRALASLVRLELEDHPITKGMIGRIDTTEGRHWLDIIFPEGPPQDYEVTGIEIAGEFVALSTKVVTQEEYQILKRTILPTAAFWGSLASARYQFDLQFNKIRELFGYKPTFENDALIIRSHLQRAAAANRARSEAAASSKSGIPPKSIQDAPKTTEKRDTSSSQDPSQSSTTNSSASTDQKKVGLPKLAQITPEAEEAPVTLFLFLQNMANRMKPLELEPPRGTVIITGLVEVIGTRGRATMNVVAAYHPKKQLFEVISWNFGIVQPRSQPPRGGQ